MAPPLVLSAAGAAGPATADAGLVSDPLAAAGLLAVLAAALLWFALAVWALSQRSRARAAAIAARHQADFHRTLAAAAPGGYLIAAGGERCYLSDLAARWLGHSPNRPASLDAIIAAAGLAGADAASLKALLEGGVEAEAEIPVSDARVIKARYRGRIQAPDGERCDILWLDDVTPGDAAAAQATDALGPMNAAPYPVWIRNAALDLVAVNPAYVRAVEREDAASVLAEQVEIVNALTGNSRAAAGRARAAAAAVVERHYAVLEGHRRAVALTDVPMEGGQKVAGFAVDVTEAEEARAELSRFIDSQSETLDKLSSPVAIFDAERRLRFFNSAFARLWRLTEDWLAEHPDHGTILETLRERRRLPEQADFRAWKAKQLALYKTAEPSEEMWHLPDGTALHQVSQPHPLGGILLLYEDVSDRLALESSYNTLIAVQRATLNNLHEAVAVYGGDGRLKLYNQNYAALWNLDTRFLDGEPHFGAVIDRCRPLLHKAGDWSEERARLLGQVTGREPLSGRWHRPDNTVLDYALVPLPDGNMLITHVDVSDTVRIEHALRERNEALETADRLKSEFVANMSYELRTPLNSIIGFTEILDHGIAGALSEKQLGYVRYVLEAAGQLRDLIDDILDLAVIEAGGMVLERKPVAVADLVESVVAMSREHARHAKVRLTTDIAAETGEILGDRRRLLQALYNLATNAFKFTPPGGVVTVSARPLGDSHVELAVADTGIGIGADERSAVFKKFYTGVNLPQKKGAGLGLSLVQSFVRLHEGTVDLITGPNEGTKVIIELPRGLAEGAKLEKAI